MPPFQPKPAVPPARRVFISRSSVSCCCCWIDRITFVSFSLSASLMMSRRNLLMSEIWRRRLGIRAEIKPKVIPRIDFKMNSCAPPSQLPCDCVLIAVISNVLAQIEPSSNNSLSSRFLPSQNKRAIKISESGKRKPKPEIDPPTSKTANARSFHSRSSFPTQLNL